MAMVAERKIRRNAIAGHKEVLSKHTYKHHAEEMLNKVRNEYLE